jgi:hypothetical protein
MTALLDTCGRLREKMHSYAERERAKERARALSEHREELKRKAEALERVIAPWRVLEQHQVPGIKRPIPLQGVTEGLPELYRRLNEEPESLNAGQVLNRCLRGLDNLEEKYREQVATVWKRFSDNDLHPGVTPQLIEMFQSLPDCKRAAADLVEALERHREASASPPGTEADWKRCQNTFERCRHLVQRLPLKDLPDEVKRFLRSASGEGAPLRAFTEGVRQWIDQHGLSNSFVIRSGISTNSTTKRV